MSSVAIAEKDFIMYLMHHSELWESFGKMNTKIYRDKFMRLASGLETIERTMVVARRNETSIRMLFADSLDDNSPHHMIRKVTRTVVRIAGWACSFPFDGEAWLAV